MILNWGKANNNYRAFERVIGALFDAGGILWRDDLKTLLGFSEDMMRYVIYRINRMEPKLIRHIRLPDRRSTYAYILTSEGVTYAKDLVGWEKKVRVAESQAYHTLGINSVLMRIVREVGTEGYEWHNTRESGEIVADSIATKLAEEGRGREKFRYNRPDAMFSVGGRKVMVEWDRGSESGKILKDKMKDYQYTMMKLPESWRVVVYVTPTVARRNFLAAKFEEVAMTAYKAHFFVEGGETAGFVQRVKRGLRPSV
ncbi:replication-relaxation family protein [Alicyclobacillus fodiniaquatilis]|uniref:Replication-relaxation family protein n=1 Tax=Alicyclobacillus fodiniaquatilis TaxID=1661150 RepID=A0ABW4JJ39_9BACL